LNIRGEGYSPTGPQRPAPETPGARADQDLRRLAYRYGVRVEDLEAYLARGLDHAE
jgi:hypothetical protein